MRKSVEAATVQAIIVTWNKKDDVTRLLSQLKRIDYPPDRFSVLVVDNHSTDGTAETLETNYPSVTLLKQKENLGGAGGFNAGMRWALKYHPEAEYLWLLDNDVLVAPDALRALVSVMAANPRAAVCGSKIMNIDKRGEVIETGAFIDYRAGDIRSNRPGYGAYYDKKDKKDKKDEKVVKVDYVAACSLLARASAVEKMGLWRESFFIYWDDMEWGARFNRAGYDVLAANESVVYHPSWVERTADHSVVWRNYYRVRNSLWFFNNYGSGPQRRLLLARMIFRFMTYAVGNSVNSNAALSQAFADGIRDFFSGRYGKKAFSPAKTNLVERISEGESGSLPVFVADAMSSDKVLAFLRALLKNNPSCRVKAVIPEAAFGIWRRRFHESDLIRYKRYQNGRIPFSDKIKIMRFLKNIDPWQVMVCPPRPPRMASIWGRDMAKINFDKGSVVSIERVRLKDSFRMVWDTPAFLFRALCFPPKKDISIPGL